MKLVAPTVPNHTPTDRAGHYLLISQVFNTFCLFFFFVFITFIVATVNAERISSVRDSAVLNSHPDMLLSSP